MAEPTYDYVENDGKTKTTSTYTCDTKGLSYTIIGDNIREDFSFLTGDFCEKLDEVESIIKSCLDLNAFDIKSGNNSVVNISDAYDDIKSDVEKIKAGLNVLFNAIMTDIDNVNAELENNFGYWIFNHVKLAGKKTEEVK